MKTKLIFVLLILLPWLCKAEEYGIVSWWNYNYSSNLSCMNRECNIQINININDRFINYYLEDKQVFLWALLTLEKSFSSTWNYSQLTNHYNSTNLLFDTFPIENNQEMLGPPSSFNPRTKYISPLNEVIWMDKSTNLWVPLKFEAKKNFSLPLLESGTYIPQLFFFVKDNKDNLTINKEDNLSLFRVVKTKWSIWTNFWPSGNLNSISSIEAIRTVHYLRPITIWNPIRNLPITLFPQINYNGQRWTTSKYNNNFQIASHESLSQDHLVIDNRKYDNSQIITLAFPGIAEFSRNKVLFKKIPLDFSSAQTNIWVTLPNWNKLDYNNIKLNEAILEEDEFTSWWNFCFVTWKSNITFKFNQQWKYNFDVSWNINDIYWNDYVFNGVFDVWYAIPVYTSSAIYGKSFWPNNYFDNITRFIPDSKNMDYKLKLDFYTSTWNLITKSWEWKSDWIIWASELSDFKFWQAGQYIASMEVDWIDSAWNVLHWWFKRYGLVGQEDVIINWKWNCKWAQECSYSKWSSELPPQSDTIFIWESEANTINPVLLMDNEDPDYFFVSIIRPWFIARTFFADHTAIDLWWNVKNNNFGWKKFAGINWDSENDWYENWWGAVKDQKIWAYVSMTVITEPDSKDNYQKSKIDTPVMTIDWIPYYWYYHLRSSTWRNYKLWSLYSTIWNLAPHKKWVKITHSLISPSQKMYKISCTTNIYWFCDLYDSIKLDEIGPWKSEISWNYNGIDFNLVTWADSQTIYVFDETFKNIKLIPSEESPDRPLVRKLIFKYLDFKGVTRPYFINQSNKTLTLAPKENLNLKEYKLHYTITWHGFIIESWVINSPNPIVINLDHVNLRNKYKNYDIFNNKTNQSELNDLIVLTYMLEWVWEDWEIYKAQWRSEIMLGILI